MRALPCFPIPQALSDGMNTYIYGVGRIAQVNTGTEYFLGDALGSVRQLTNTSGAITYARAYDPYGVVTTTAGTAQTSYGYTSEYNGDYNELVYLRARHYAPGMGRFLARDTWAGDANIPMSFNAWLYVDGNPINLSDPSGQFPTYVPTPHCNAITSLSKYPFLEFGVSEADMKGWTCDELIRVIHELNQFDAKVTNGLSRVITWTIPVKRIDKYGDCAFYKYSGKIEVYNGPKTYYICAPGTFGHELAHAWDHRMNLNGKFAKYVGASKFLWWYNVGNETPPIYGGGDPPNAFEDFAESVTEYVYDQGSNEQILTTEKRWKFVESLLTSGTILTLGDIPSTDCNEFANSIVVMR